MLEAAWSCAGSRVRITGPTRIASALVESLSSVRLPSDALPVLNVAVSPDAQRAEGAVDGRLVWSIALPAGAPIATLLGHIVGSVTTLLERLLFVHAGVVAFEGRGMVLLGESGAGKTSTVAALLRAGATYLSDEVALLDPVAAVVLPFALPMAIKPWTRKAAGALPAGRTVAGEGGVEFWLPRVLGTGPVAVDTFVLLGHKEPRTRLAPVSRGAMLLALARHTSSLRQQHRVHDAFAGFSKLLRGARCLELEGTCPAAHADLLMTAWSRPA